MDYRIIDEVIDDTHYQITIEAAIGEINKNKGCQNRSISQITLFRPTLQISNNVPGWMSQLPLSISKKITVELSEKPEIRLRDARHTKLNTENFQRINTSLDYKSLIKFSLIEVIKHALKKTSEYGISNGHHFI